MEKLIEYEGHKAKIQVTTETYHSIIGGLEHTTIVKLTASQLRCVEGELGDVYIEELEGLFMDWFMDVIDDKLDIIHEPETPIEDVQDNKEL